jgi:hypothetical protein
MRSSPHLHSPWRLAAPSLATLTARIASLGDRLGPNPKARATLHVPEDRRRSKFDGLLGTVGRT